MDVEALRVEIYRRFAGTGRPPARAELAAAVGGDEAEIRAGLRELARVRHLVIDADGRS